MVASTGVNDAKLIKQVRELSQSRVMEGRFAVSLAFWDTIESLIRQHPELARQYDPYSTSGILFQVREELREQRVLIEQHTRPSRPLAEVVPAETTAEPLDVLKSLVSGQLDEIRALTLDGKFKDALARLTTLGASFPAFDALQKARWQSQRANCLWRLGDEAEAIKCFEAAYELAPSDERIAANLVLTKLLRKENEAAQSLANELVKKFPVSTPVWALWGHATIAAGKNLEEAMFPTEVRNKPDITHVIAVDALFRRDFARASLYARRALEAGSTSFETRTVLLDSCLNAVVADDVNQHFGLVPDEFNRALENAVESFLPTASKLWSNQGGDAVIAVAGNLGIALAVLGRKADSITLLREAVEKAPNNADVLQALLQVLLKDGREDEAIRLAISRKEMLTSHAAFLIAQSAANQGSADALDEALQIVAASDLPDDLKGVAQSFRWVLLAKEERWTDVVQAVEAARLDATSDNIKLLSLAARLTFKHAPYVAEKIADHALDVVGRGASKPDRVLAAQMCGALGRQSKVCELLGPIALPGFFTELHGPLIWAYLKTGQLKRARNLVTSLPPGALSDEALRRTVIALARETRDWNLLSDLSKVEVENRPERVESWLLRAIALNGLGESQELEQFLSAAPLTLGGDATDIGRLAWLEQRQGLHEQALKRIYRHWRLQPENPDVLKAFMLLGVSAPSELLGVAPTSVVAATSMELVDVDTGDRTRLTIDPAGLEGLAESTIFVAPENADAAQIVGRRVGDEFIQPSSVGGNRRLRIVELDNAYRFALTQVHRTLEKAPRPLEGFGTLRVRHPVTDEIDLSELEAPLRQRREHAELAFDLYGQNSSVTLGLLAKTLGVTAAELALAWPATDGAMSRALLNEQAVAALVKHATRPCERSQ